MNTFDRNLNLDGLFKFSQISYSTQQHLKKVYSSLAICMLLAAAGAYVHVVTRIFQGGLVSTLISLGLIVWLASTPHSPETERRRLCILSGFAFFTGTGLGPLMDFVISINPSIIPTAFLASALVFLCFTLSALYAQRRSYLFLGGTLMSVLTVLCFVPLVNLFFGSVLLFKAQLYVGLVVFCGFILFDTQLIIEKAEHGDKDYIWHCVDLFMDFIAIFRKLLLIMGMNEKEKKRRNDSK